jgi:hypothetical protein
MLLKYHPDLLATFALLNDVKAWMDERYKPDGYNVGGTAGPLEDKSPCTPTCM